MPSPGSVPQQPFTRKGKRFFIDVLDKSKHVSALVAEMAYVFMNPQTREVVLYFKRRFRLFPNILVPLACAINHFRADGRRIRVNETFDELEETTYLDTGVARSNEMSARDLVGRVWRYEAPTDVYELVAGTVDYLSYHLQWERGTLHAMEWSLYEVLDNVFQHSEADAGFFMFQVQEQSRRLSYCVADQGRGIYSSLAGSKYNPSTPLDAITLAVRKGVTRNPVSNMGNGLWGATEIVARSGGQITISSGGAALFFNRSSAQAQSFPKVHVLNRQAPGTFIDAQMDASVEVHMSEMFDGLSLPVNLRLENLEDEYGAVRVLVKDMRFGAGTRQSGELARIRVTNLLTEFDGPVVIDFTGIGIVSSSFADEFIAKLFLHLGAEVFNNRVRLREMNETNNVIVRSVLAQRLGEG